MMQKIHLAVIFGGKSAEHEVALQSAKNIIKAIDNTKYRVVLIKIDKGGRWFFVPEKKPVTINLGSKKPLGNIDIVFPVLHGPYGEDGTVQGLLELLGIPFVGSGVLGSAIGMEKDITKRLLKQAGLPVANYLVLHKNETIDFKKVKAFLGLPFFVKPANLGSSIGITKVSKEEEFVEALKNAFLHSPKILIEECIKGREIECSVLGNNNPIASLPGEIIPQHSFYSYEAKYIDPNGAILRAPAILEKRVIEKIQELAIKTFKILCCFGMARVDFFLKEDNELLVNEVNTIPGFTKISMYPKLWEVSGIPYPKLIDKLIQLGLERQKI